MGFSLKTQSYFNAAHFLTNYKGKCENLHGHRWQVIVYLYKEILSSQGEDKDMLIDFGEFKQIVRAEVKKFDHTFIVEENSLHPETVRALEQETFKLTFVPFRTTSENFAQYFYQRFCALGLPVVRVEVDETPHNCAIYEA